MAPRKRKTRAPKEVGTLRHDEASRTNIPTAEDEALMHVSDRNPIPVAYERRYRELNPQLVAIAGHVAHVRVDERRNRNPERDPQLVWKGKDAQDRRDLLVQAPPLYVQEKVHPKALIDDLLRHSKENAGDADPERQTDMFADFNGLPDGAERTEFYQHEANWSNRMILGDSLAVMAALAEREGLRGKVQCVYIDPPYGTSFNSNFQWSTTGRADKGDKPEHITREPEPVKAYRDTWAKGIHSYLSYLRDRLTAARDLLTDSGSVFVQIGDENVHRVRALMDEVFGDENFISLIPFRTKTMPFGTNFIEQMSSFIIWYSRSREYAQSKYRKLFRDMDYKPNRTFKYYRMSDGSFWSVPKGVHELEQLPEGARLFRSKSLEPSGRMESGMFVFNHEGIEYEHPRNGYGTDNLGLRRLDFSRRIIPVGNMINYVLFSEDKAYGDRTSPWEDTVGADNKVYVVQTNTEVVKRCILMTTDPGDLVLDPTCGSGTTAYVAEQWGRRWITIDTSRVALALARARIMGARYQWYLLADSPEGQAKEAEVTQREPSNADTYGDIRQGFVYERVPHITLKSIANNAEIDVIHARWGETLEPLRARLNELLGEAWEEWEVPREPGADWPDEAAAAQAEWQEARIARQREIDASIAARADHEYLYDKPYVDKARVRVAGPFTVESLAPHRILGVDENGDLIDGVAEPPADYDPPPDFTSMILENLERAGVQQAHKEDGIAFSSIEPWPGELVAAAAYYVKGGGGGYGRRRRGAARGRLHRAGVRDGLAGGPCRGRARGGGSGFRRAHRLRLQLRGAHDRVRPAGAHPRAQGAHERRPAHGGRPEEHGQGQPLRHLRRARH